MIFIILYNLQQRGPPYKCQICTKVFVNRNRFNYHQKKRGACPGVPVAPKPHKYIGNRYYCIHKDCLPEGVELNVDIHPQYTNRTQVKSFIRIILQGHKFFNYLIHCVLQHFILLFS